MPSGGPRPDQLTELAEVVALAERHAHVAQDVVGRHDVKVEVRQRPGAQEGEPIEADEVAAFKRALASAGAATAAPAAAAKPGVPVRSGPLLSPSRPTGFEDTEMPGSDGPSPDLSSTQYGELH